MTILTAADQPVFFPEVPVNPALTGYIYLAQGICEGAFGANRPLETQSHLEQKEVNQAGWFFHLDMVPVVEITAVEVRLHDGWRRTTTLDWMPLDPQAWSLTPPLGRVELAVMASEVKVTYTSGFDFAVPSADTQMIKAIAGLVLSHMATKNPGLDSQSFNPTTGDAYSYNYAKLDDYLKSILIPLKRYMPRSV
jgi:hypothetical protein